jgi:uncharacterized membrane protein
MTIRNPIEWGMDQLRIGAESVGSAGRAVGRLQEEADAPAPAVRRIAPADLRDVLARGFDDFLAFRTDVIVLCFIYPVIGLVLARLAFGYEMLPLIFPIASGFALIGPVAALGLYELSRRREQGAPAGWPEAFGVLHAPSFGPVVVLGLLLVGIYLAWLFAAQTIYDVTVGPEPPTSLAGFMSDVFTTRAGWTMIVVGMGVGFLFALLVLAIGVVSFPLLLDRPVRLDTAIGTSFRAVATNPVTMAIWGLVVALSLVVGSIPFFLGLIFVVPILGHATWHLYRKVVTR